MNDKNRFTINIDEDESDNVSIVTKKFLNLKKYLKASIFLFIVLFVFYFSFKFNLLSQINQKIDEFLGNQNQPNIPTDSITFTNLMEDFYLPEGSKNIKLAKCLNLYKKNFYKQAQLHCQEFSDSSPNKKEKSIALTVLGIISDQEGNFQAAYETLEKAAKEDETNLYALYNLALVYKHLGDFVNARIAITKAKEISPTDPKISLLAGNLLNEFNEPKKAIQNYEDGLKKEPNNNYLIYNLALTHYKEGKITKAIENFKKAASLGNGKVALDSYGYLGSIYFDNQDYEKSEEFFRQAVNLFPSSPKYLYNLARVLYLQNKKKESLIYLKKSLISNVYDLVVYQSIASLFLELNEHELAVQSLEKGLKINPKEIDLLFTLSRLYEKKGDYINAEDTYRKIISFTPGNTFTKQALFNLSQLYQKMDRFRESEEILKKLISIDLNNYKAYYELGKIDYHFGKFDLALKNWQKTLELNPDFFEADEKIGDYFYKNGLYEKAANRYISILKKNENLFSIYLKLANVYLSQNKILEAQAIFQKVSQKSQEKQDLKLAYKGLAKTYMILDTPSDIEKSKEQAYIALNIDYQDMKTRLFLVEVLMKSDLASDREQAIDELEIIIRSNVDSMILAKSYNYLGLCYHKKGQDEKAVDFYQKALDIYPNFAEAYQNKKFSLNSIKKNVSFF